MGRVLTDHIVEGGGVPMIITVLDEPGAGGACHRYECRLPEGRFKNLVNDPTGETVVINFQDGPIKVAGHNGHTHESLLAIIADRLDGFQTGEFACQDNAEAVHHVRCALACLQRRTLRRLAAGVEGTMKIDEANESGIARPVVPVEEPGDDTGTTESILDVDEPAGGGDLGDDTSTADDKGVEVIGNLDEPPTAPVEDPQEAELQKMIDEEEKNKGGEA
jgi:hypothetical protein